MRLAPGFAPDRGGTRMGVVMIALPISISHFVVRTVLGAGEESLDGECHRGLDRWR
jgi:hypothetical protein